MTVRATTKNVARQWHGRWKRMPEIVVNVFAATAGKARAEIARKAREAGYDATVPEIQVRRGEWLKGFSVWV